jgi:predicted DNA-binding transcriptional regulator AlpA
MTVRSIRLVEIAHLLGVSKQRAHQLAAAEVFPAPVARTPAALAITSIVLIVVSASS